MAGWLATASFDQGPTARVMCASGRCVLSACSTGVVRMSAPNGPGWISKMRGVCAMGCRTLRAARNAPHEPNRRTKRSTTRRDSFLTIYLSFARSPLVASGGAGLHRELACDNADHPSASWLVVALSLVPNNQRGITTKTERPTFSIPTRSVPFPTCYAVGIAPKLDV